MKMPALILLLLYTSLYYLEKSHDGKNVDVCVQLFKFEHVRIYCFSPWEVRSDRLVGFSSHHSS